MEKIVKNMDGSKASNILPHTEETMENVKDKANEYWEKAKETTQGLFNDAESNGLKTWSQAKSLIQSHPAQAVGYAVMLGIAVGVLFSTIGQD